MANGKHRPVRNPLAGCVNLFLFLVLVALFVALFVAFLPGGR